MTPTSLHMDFDERLVIDTTDKKNWTENPPDPLRRVRLESNTKKRADGTSIVHYPAGSNFPGHNHPGGEEILVLDGIFQDENGAYPAGTYIRNPIGYYHDPYSDDGCTIFVKLRRFKENDTEQKIIQTKDQEWLPGLVPGLRVMPLHEHEGENVALVKWASNTHFNPHKHWGG